jgi:casein kinase 1, epsilon
VIDVAFVGQENVKTKHPQLHYESKLYMLLQGGSKLMSMEPIHTQSETRIMESP